MRLGRLIAAMGLLYAWATPDYILWHMTIGQVVLLHNYGMELKYPQPEKDKPKSVKEMTAAEMRAKKEELHRLYGDADA